MSRADVKDALRQQIANFLVRDESPANAMLARKGTENASAPPILALYTECSSKPLLFTVNIPRLGALADKYDFLVVIDETVETFAKQTLSKYLDGYATVLGGRVHLASTFEDTYSTPDATAMEWNSRDFFERMHIINANTGYIRGFLCVHSIEGEASEGEGAVIKQVWYPKYITPGNYQICCRHLPTGKLDHKIRGYGGLFSLTFTSLDTSRAFYDVLEVAKGSFIA
ncbi:hypothetical protein BKA82DRAFT_4161103 [Pisolithus tinctorius]|nr:hypothetical protein BKA82DRAFT_4161103 [Pisolithus tinctorius]